MNNVKDRRYIVLCGGVGGSRFADGLAQILPPSALTIIVNTADDFDHLGLRICPDIDTVTYMLSGLVDEARGWGRGDESWSALEVLGTLGQPTWFQLGDRDLGLHLARSHLLAEGHSLTETTVALSSRLGVAHPILPMCDEPVASVLATDEGNLDFQRYFVQRRCEPIVSSHYLTGIDQARISDRVASALADQSLAGIFIAPSNPILSIAPILAVPGMRDAIRATGVPVLAVSPFVEGRPVKGPLAKLFAELGMAAGDPGLFEYYRNLVDMFVADSFDGALDNGAMVFRTDLLMADANGRSRLAAFCLKSIHADSAAR
ncbi:MAG: 2-phospho-L-lactate transferase [Salinisphaera sp.]|nr:2-phospho-L-lactate transferase [Salinisphaera sp.]